jgi:hypothetical protein
MTVKRLLANRGVVEISQPPYSPDLVRAEFSLFREIKARSKQFSVRRWHQEERNG